MVCTISGLCSESLLVQDDSDADEEEAEQEAEVLTGRGRFGTYLSPSAPFPLILFISNI